MNGGYSPLRRWLRDQRAAGLPDDPMPSDAFVPRYTVSYAWHVPPYTPTYVWHVPPRTVNPPDPHRRAKTVQAKHIPDTEVLALVDRLSRQSRLDLAPMLLLRKGDTRTVGLYEMQKAMEYPEKVVQAKMRSLIRRGLVDGCACGCSGSFSITAAGQEALRRAT